VPQINWVNQQVLLFGIQWGILKPWSGQFFLRTELKGRLGFLVLKGLAGFISLVQTLEVLTGTHGLRQVPINKVWDRIKKRIRAPIGGGGNE